MKLSEYLRNSNFTISMTKSISKLVKMEFWGIILKSPILCKSFSQKLSFAYAEGLNSHFKGVYVILTQSRIYSSSVCVGIAQIAHF